MDSYVEMRKNCVMKRPVVEISFALRDIDIFSCWESALTWMSETVYVRKSVRTLSPSACVLHMFTLSG